jgi:hypothetical protein
MKPGIAAIMCTLDEGDIIEATVRHAFVQGVSELYVVEDPIQARPGSTSSLRRRPLG